MVKYVRRLLLEAGFKPDPQPFFMSVNGSSYASPASEGCYLGTAAGGLVKVLANELGLKAEEATPDAFMKVLELDPNAVLKFKEFEMAHKVDIQKLILEEERMYLQDRADARSRQVESEKATGKRDINLYVLAWMVVGLFFCDLLDPQGADSCESW